MSKPFFSTPERIAALDKEARSWTGTPFAPHAMVKGAGADCVHLVAGIYLACGALSSFNAGSYSLDSGALLTKWFGDKPQFAPVTVPEIQAGDALCLRYGRFSHAALLLHDGNLIHSLPGRRATISNLRESFYRKAIFAAYRPIEP